MDVLHLKRGILFVNVTSFNNAVTSFMMSQCHTCISHVTIYCTKAANTLAGEFQSVCWFVRFDSLTQDPRVAGV